MTKIRTKVPTIVAPVFKSRPTPGRIEVLASRSSHAARPLTCKSSQGPVAVLHPRQHSDPLDERALQAREPLVSEELLIVQQKLQEASVPHPAVSSYRFSTRAGEESEAAAGM